MLGKDLRDWGDDVVREVLVLIVPEHQDEVGVKRLDLGAELPKGLDQPPPVLAVRATPSSWPHSARTPAGQLSGFFSSAGTLGSLASAKIPSP